ncbi:MAG: zinc ribbon domain-containing protein [Candidatus Thermoplasmatota archaeon]
MAIPLAYATTRNRRAPPSLPLGWGAVTVLLVGAALLIIGIVIILLGFFDFISGTVGAATSSSFSVTTFFQSFVGSMILFVVGGVLAGVGGWLVRLWWLFLLVGVVTGAGSTGNTVREREAMRGPDVRVRCRVCGRLNPEEAKFCLSCGQAV